MPPPKLGEGRTFESPPQALMGTDRELYDYLFMLHARVFGIGTDTKGDLDLDNINPGIIPEIPEGHNAATHNSLVQAQSVVSFIADDEADATALSIIEGDADAVYGAAERDLVNELKADLNLLFAEYNLAIAVVNDIETKVNDILAAMRAANLMAAESEE